MAVDTIPDRYRYSVIPHVMVRGAAEAIEFYKKAFGAEETFRVALPDGKIIHSEIQIGESVVMLGDADSPFSDPKATGGSSVGLHVYVKDVNTLFAWAISAGATEIQPLQDMFYGDRTAMLEDPKTHPAVEKRWQIAVRRPQINVFTAGFRQHGSEFGVGQRTGERQQPGRHPNQQNYFGRADLLRHHAGFQEYSRSDYRADD